MCDQSRSYENTTEAVGGAVAGARSHDWCDELEGLFSYMNNWFGGECGNVAGTWCAEGNNYVAGENGAEYFAYCAQRN